MEMDIDDDFSDISEDKIQHFLQSKLSEITIEKQNLEIMLKEHQQQLSETCLQQTTLQIEYNWKKLVNCKYVICLKVTCSEKFQDIQVYLNYCDKFEKTLEYETKSFSTSAASCSNCVLCQCIICGVLLQTTSFDNEAYVSISFEIPEFLKHSHVSLSGYILATTSKKLDEISGQLPEISISVNDFTSMPNNFSLQDQSLPNLLALTASGQQSDLVMILPDEWVTPLDCTFEINCSLTYLHVGNGFFYLANRISEVFDRSVLIIHPANQSKELFLKVYTANENVLYPFVHHLLTCIKGSYIVPKSVFLKMNINRGIVRKNLLEEFKSNMLNEVSVGRMYCKSLEIVGGRSTREKLNDQESKTDLTFLEVMALN
ncbi:uncharacterized protein [Euwallacea fornicatus]|uniref:uncharacterized protein n=1 Tax=Euwallacea fornicatus TaxID=995702 RepID=UPI00338FC573